MGAGSQRRSCLAESPCERIGLGPPEQNSETSNSKRRIEREQRTRPSQGHWSHIAGPVGRNTSRARQITICKIQGFSSTARSRWGWRHRTTTRRPPYDHPTTTKRPPDDHRTTTARPLAQLRKSSHWHDRLHLRLIIGYMRFVLAHVHKGQNWENCRSIDLK